jgi:glycerophosphoryl diester phosphodiesterase
MPDLIRVGHKGADGIVTGNTLASFDAALDLGVDMIEFDIMPYPRTGQLVLAHDPRVAREGDPPTLEEGLRHLAGPRFAGVQFDVDLKSLGYEADVVDALREHAMFDRSVICSQIVDSLATLRAAAPDARIGWSVPHLKNDPFRNPMMRIPATIVGATYRELLPRRAAEAIRSGFAQALMAHWRLITPRLVRAVQGEGGQLFVWTVDDAAQLRRLADLGVDGLITNDPRLFTTAGLT